MKKWITSLALFGMMSASHAGFLSTEDLQKLLTSKKPADRDAATLYILGVHDSYNPGVSCVEDGTKAEKLTIVVTYFINKNPQLLANPADNTVISILSFVWPCKSEPSEKSPKKGEMLL